MAMDDTDPQVAQKNVFSSAKTLRAWYVLYNFE